MEKYLSRLESVCFSRPPREALNYAAGGEIFGPEMHLTFNTAPYIITGRYIRELGKDTGEILEIGCGTGYDTSYLKEYFAPEAAITGIDRIPALTNYASRNYSRSGLTFLTADSCHLPFPRESFDLVFSVFSIPHTMSPTRARECLAQVLRILKPEGILIFTTPNRELSQNLYQENPEDDPDVFFCHLLRHEYDREELRSLLLQFTGETNERFRSFSIDSLTNISFQPVWKETLATMGRKRFTDSRRESPLPYLLRRLLPQNVKALWFFRMIRKKCRRRKISLFDIARGARHYPESEGVDGEHFLVVARKGG